MYFSSAFTETDLMYMDLGDVQEYRYIMFKEQFEYDRIEKLRAEAKKKQEENIKNHRDENHGIEPILSEFPLPSPCPINDGLGGLGGLFR